MEEYRVDADLENFEPRLYGAAENMAKDERILELAASEQVPYLRLYGFEQPAFVPSRRTSLEDVRPALDSGFEVTRRNTNGSTIPCLENGLAYSVAYPTDDFPDTVFEEKVAPALIEGLEYAGLDEVSSSVKHESIRYGDRSTPGEAAQGKTLVGSSSWRTDGAVLSHGVIAVEPWDAEFLDESMVLRPGEKEFIETLPSVESTGGIQDDLIYGLLEGFTEGKYSGTDISDIDALLEDKYRDDEWIDFGSVDGRGHCFVEREEDRFY